MGLVTKTIDKPALIQAISVEAALAVLVEKENDKIRKHMSHLKTNMKELSSLAVNRPLIEKPREENLFVALTTDEQVKSVSKVTFEKICKEYEMMVNLDLMSSIMQNLRNHIRQVGNRAKIRILVESQNPRQKKIIIDTIDNLRPKTGDFSAKIIPRMESINYYLIDDSELWISMQNKTESGLPCVLWTNDNKMVDFFHENFHQGWDDPSAFSIVDSQNRDNNRENGKEFSEFKKEVVVA